ncbi:hypothetical protein [Desulfogranum marinum]|uniref:hypothetical protein n=1 Tax=Desulfogranum marinum TaxID=453220 RepID=UPI0029C6CABF|nr:hypothetical protein [Desulfogranum marinum]
MGMKYIICHLLLVLVAPACFLGCASAPRGKVVVDSAVEKLFSSATVIPGHNYYYYGRQQSPVAIIALQQKYQLVSRLWTSLKQPEQQLASLINNTRQQRNSMCTFSGAVIKAPDGTAAGYWYAKWHLTSVRIAEPGKIEVFPPAEPTYGPCKPEGFKQN